MGPKHRFGYVRYINALPMVGAFLEKALNIDAELVEGCPAELNMWLREGHLDISLISTAEYMKNKASYHLIPEFGIAARGPVESVLLYTKKPLHNQLIGLSPESATSVLLLKLLCNKYWKVRPTFEVIQEGKIYDAFLLIGDKALVNPFIAGYETTDLAAAWFEHTRLPVPFAVLASKKPTCMPILKEALKWGRQNPERIVQLCQKQVSLPKETISRYLQRLTFEFTEQEHLGLEALMKEGSSYV